MKNWIEQEADKDSVINLQESIGTSPLLAKLLVQRGLSDHSVAKKFLRPKLLYLEDPFSILNMDKAISRILLAREKKQKVLIVGDYDVDGITSTVMIKQALKSIDIHAETIIPKRLSEGYGLTREVLERGLRKESFELVIALDCGTNSIQEAEFLSSSGIDLIVVDHHQLKSPSQPRAILVNPHLQEDKGEPWRHLCTAGLCFKLIHALYKKMREIKVPGADKLTPRDFMPLSAIATLADLVPLNGESRIICKFGIKRLFIDSSPGLLTLLRECGLDGTFPTDTEDITYKLAPRINACGRLNKPEKAVLLLLDQEPQNCRKLAKELTQLNEDRKKIESQLTADALAQADKFFKEKSAVVVTGEGDAWHPGVVGIVAGKLANSLNKPCLVMAKSAEGEYCGSGRGLPGFNLVKILSMCQDKLTHWGGHPVAVGLGLKDENLNAFIQQFLDSVDKNSCPEEQSISLKVDAFVNKDELDFELLDELNELGPFGQNNPEPILGVKQVVFETTPRKISNGEHFSFSFHNGNGYVRGIAWRMGDKIPPVGQKLDLVFKIRKNHWNGQSNLQLVLEDWKFSETR